MAIKNVVQNPSPVLKQTAETVTNFKDPELKRLIADMKETMVAQDGLGLAAPQINVSRALFVITEEVAPRLRQLNSPFSIFSPKKKTVFINPRILSESKEKEDGEEGCLSVRGYFADLKRPREVVIVAKDEKGRRFKLKGRGLLARALAHETDHLRGVLFIDRLHEL